MTARAQQIPSDSLDIANFSRLLESEKDSLTVKKSFQRIAEICKEKGWWETYLEAGFQYMLWLSDKISWEAADEEADQLIELASKELRKPGLWLGKLYHKKGLFNFYSDDLDQSVLAYERAVQIRKNDPGGKIIDLARSLFNLSIVMRYKGNLHAASQLLEESIALQKQLDEPELLADTYMELGILKFHSGDFGSSDEFMSTALQMYEQKMAEVGNDVDEGLLWDIAYAYNNLHALYHYKKDNLAAKKALEQSIAIYEQLNYSWNIGSASQNLATVHRHLGDYGSALAHYRKARKIFGEIKSDSELAKVHHNLGLLYKVMEDEKVMEKRDYRQAHEHFITALKIKRRNYKSVEFHPEYAKDYNAIGDLFKAQGELLEAAKNYHLALRNQIVNFHEDHYHANPAIDGIGLVAPLTEVLQSLKNKASILVVKYDTEKIQRDLQAALQTYQLCDQLIDQMRNGFESADSKLFLQEQAIPMYEQAISTAYELYWQTREPQYLEAAFRMMEKSKAILLLTSIKDSKAKEYANIPDSVVHKINRYKADIAYLEKRIAQARMNQDERILTQDLPKLPLLKRDYLALVVQLEKDYPRYHQEKYNLKAASIPKLQEHLESTGSTLIEYFVGEQNIYIFLLSAENMQLIRTTAPQIDLVGELINSIRSIEAIHDGLKVKRYQYAAHELYKMIWQPVASRISTGQRIIIVPAGELGHLPFEVLLEEQPHHLKFKQYPYLLRKYAISYAYSATVLLENLGYQEGQRRSSFLGIAPVFAAGAGLSHLPYSKGEVQQIQQAMAGKVLLQHEASRLAFVKEAPNYDILHLSTHAVVQEEPFDAWIEFIDGPLHIHEMDTMNLQARMVVLSACETGSGQLLRGEGIASLAKRFAYAGSRSIVSSIWQVNHRSTANLMNRFYQHLERSLAKDEALRAAKLAYLNDDTVDQAEAHPYYWASFMTFGDRSAIYKKRSLLAGGPGVIAGIIFLLLIGLFVVYQLFHTPGYRRFKEVARSN